MQRASCAVQHRLLLRRQQHHFLQQQQQHLLQQRAAFSSSYDIFKKLKDPPDENESKTLARKPSDKVLRLVDEVMSLTLIEAADLCDLCQEKLAQRGNGFAAAGQPAAATPAAPAAGSPAAEPAAAAGDAAAKAKAPQEEKKAAFSIRLLGFEAAKKVSVVKEVRAMTSLGLKEAKELVEQAPKVIKKAVPAAEAEALKAKLEAAGGQVALE